MQRFSRATTKLKKTLETAETDDHPLKQIHSFSVLIRMIRYCCYLAAQVTKEAHGCLVDRAVCFQHCCRCLWQTLAQTCRASRLRHACWTSVGSRCADVEMSAMMTDTIIERWRQYWLQSAVVMVAPTAARVPCAAMPAGPRMKSTLYIEDRVPCPSLVSRRRNKLSQLYCFVD